MQCRTDSGRQWALLHPPVRCCGDCRCSRCECNSCVDTLRFLKICTLKFPFFSPPLSTIFAQVVIHVGRFFIQDVTHNILHTWHEPIRAAVRCAQPRPCCCQQVLFDHNEKKMKETLVPNFFFSSYVQCKTYIISRTRHTTLPYAAHELDLVVANCLSKLQSASTTRLACTLP